MTGGTPNNRVSTAQFYEALLKQNGRMDDMERRIMAELKGVPNQVETNKEEIDRLRKRSNYWDAGNTLGLLIAGVLSAIGINK